MSNRGFPVPWFVYWPKGKEPEFRVIGPGRLNRALSEGLCWVCGQPFTNRRRSFVLGPMCAVNRISSEPPNHEECAVFSAVACPFLARPHMVRRENDLPPERLKPEERDIPAIAQVMHNPGVVLVWHTRSFEVLQIGKDVLFRVGEPTGWEWYCEGRPATRDECFDAVNKGLPFARRSCGGNVAALLEIEERAAWVVENLFPKLAKESLGVS